MCNQDPGFSSAAAALGPMSVAREAAHEPRRNFSFGFLVAPSLVAALLPDAVVAQELEFCLALLRVPRSPCSLASCRDKHISA